MQLTTQKEPCQEPLVIFGRWESQWEVNVKSEGVLLTSNFVQTHFELEDDVAEAVWVEEEHDWNQDADED